MVNSRHRRSIKDCPMLDKVAFCEDGYPDESPKQKPRKKLNEVLEWY